MVRGKKKWMLFLAAAAVPVVLIMLGLNGKLTARAYEVKSELVSSPVRFALVTDLHSCDYGAGQSELLSAVEAQAPDAVLLGGDMVDDERRMDAEKAYEAVAALAGRWPTYYVTGNHEHWSGRVEEIKARLTACGAVVLSGETSMLNVSGQQLLIAGLDDPAAGEDAWRTQLAAVSHEAGEGTFSVLLSHRPERTDAYRETAFDLVVAGHAHGGQWRLPGLINGLLAPNQGLFPKYAGGQYDLDGTSMVVSRGLARESTRLPRLFNPPELVVVTVSPR